ncbi:anthranilate synthase component II [Sessilibacter corallicola]|uniref:Aminodeoxychorismate/anthranilate synthase component II n=1 Tax=Sessilibacter corallicola TaxID=2904075 RepID=A0ABQ0A5A2_9GAMM|nr:aminodeoxychorismate/anthranilate synthase component II [Sessilibacter corallicola]MCE2026703.1 aminodeoxychorismate/anthranilate synthase component II [Sessilibacter corallicola]
MKILIIDNFDSFTYNLFQLISRCVLEVDSQSEVVVKRNNEVDVSFIESFKPTHIVISPGPGSPDNIEYFGACSEIIEQFSDLIPMLGICLGMQGLANVYGAKIVESENPCHGKTSIVQHTNSGILKGLPHRFETMRYHSLVVDRNTLPNCFEVTAVCHDEGQEVIMALRHENGLLEGLQFHPESFATDFSDKIISNFLSK